MEASICKRPMTWGSIALLLAVVVLAYRPGLSGPFVLDDFAIIFGNTLLVEAIEKGNWFAAAFFYDASFPRPLPMLSFAIDAYFGGDHPSTYKQTNVLIHCVATMLVVTFLYLCLRLSDTKGSLVPAWYWAIAAGSLWAVHPLQVSTVLYATQRMEMLAAIFMLLAAVCYLRARKKQIDRDVWALPWLSASAFATLLALSCKETGALTPLLLLILELIFFRFRTALPSVRKLLFLSYAVYALAVLVALLMFAGPLGLDGNIYHQIRHFSLEERLLTQPRVLIMYLGWAFVPLPSTMVFHYDSFPISSGFLNPPSTLLSIFFLLAMAMFASTQSIRYPLASLAIGWFLASHLLSSSFVALEIAFEHRNYLALLILPLVLLEVCRKFKVHSSPALPHLVLALMVAASLSLTVLRSNIWGNELHLAMVNAAQEPASPRAMHDLGAAYLRMSAGHGDDPMTQFAIRSLEQAASLPNSSMLPEQGLIAIASNFGMPIQTSWWESLENKALRAPITPQDITAVQGLVRDSLRGNLLLTGDRRLLELIDTMLQTRPDVIQLIHYEADLLSKVLGNPTAAIQRWEHLSTLGDNRHLQWLIDHVLVLESEGRNQESDALAQALAKRGVSHLL